MSAGFDVAGEVFWGTNGAVEASVGALAAIATGRFGPDDPLAAFLRDEHDGWFPGKVVFLDDWLQDARACNRFLMILGDVLSSGFAREWSQYGQQWAAEAIGWLRERIGRDVP